MSWFKVDDKLHSHKKTARAGEAMALWVIAGSWVSDQLTDGFVPDYVADRLMVGARAHAARLVEVGLWSEDKLDGDTGWRFHDWHDQNPTRAQVLKERADARERMRVARERAREKRRLTSGSGELRENFGGSSGDVRLPRPDPTRPDPLTTSFVSPSRVGGGKSSSCRPESDARGDEATRPAAARSPRKTATA